MFQPDDASLHHYTLVTVPRPPKYHRRPPPSSAAATLQRPQFDVRANGYTDASNVTQKCKACVAGVVDDSDGGTDDDTDVNHSPSEKSTGEDDKDIPPPHADVGSGRQHLESVGGGGCASHSPPPLCVGVHRWGRGRGAGRGRGSARNDSSAGTGGHAGRDGRCGRNSGGESACVVPTESRMLQSPQTKAALKMM